jgi:predicted nucleic acid-binding protein
VKPAFLHTSGWFAALSPKEAKHGLARSAYVKWIESGTQLVTTNLVVAEMQILLSRFRGAVEGLRFLDSLYQDASHHVVFVNRDLERAAVDRWLRRYSDQRLSLADAVSFEVMTARSIRQVLALDEHFALAGFELVPSRAK